MPEKRHVDISTSPPYVAWAGTMREVPDMLIAAQLLLRPLAKGEAPPTTAEARRIVGDACDLLHSAMTNVLEATRHLPSGASVNDQRFDGTPADTEDLPDERRSSREHEMLFDRPDDRATQAFDPASPAAQASPFRSLEAFATQLTDEQLDRLARCAHGNTLRFESAEIVGPLIAAGYANEGPGRVVSVTPKGRRYLRSEVARRVLARPRAGH